MYGGDLHESVEITRDESRGVHMQVRRNWASTIPKETRVIRTPLGLTMSYFNAINYSLPNDQSEKSSTFSSHGLVFPRASFIDVVGPEETMVFFLMGQYLKGSEGFWFPYLRTLPRPGSLTTSLYYEGADLEWLKGTSLWPAREQRMGGWKEKFDNSLKRLRESGFEGAEEYTWYVFYFPLLKIESSFASYLFMAGICISGH